MTSVQARSLSGVHIMVKDNIHAVDLVRIESRRFFHDTFQIQLRIQQLRRKSSIQSQIYLYVCNHFQCQDITLFLKPLLNALQDLPRITRNQFCEFFSFKSNVVYCAIISSFTCVHIHVFLNGKLGIHIATITFCYLICLLISTSLCILDFCNSSRMPIIAYHPQTNVKRQQH